MLSLYTTTDLFYIMRIENESEYGNKVMWGFARLRAWKLIDIHRRVGSWNIQVPWFVSHAGRRVHQLRSRARERLWKRSGEIVNARERWEGEHSSLTRSHSHRTDHFLSASRRRKKIVRRRKRAQDSGAKPLLFLQPCSRAVFCEKEKNQPWKNLDIRREDTSLKRKKGMKENSGKLLMHSTNWHWMEKTAQSNRILSFLADFLLKSGPSVSHTSDVYFSIPEGDVRWRHSFGMPVWEWAEVRPSQSVPCMSPCVFISCICFNDVRIHPSVLFSNYLLPPSRSSQAICTAPVSVSACVGECV